MKRPTAYAAEKIFTGEEWLTDHVILAEKQRIVAIVPGNEVSGTAEITDFGNCTIHAAFVDLQIYGASGRLFSEYPDVDSLTLLHEYNLAGGAAYCVPTVATNTYAVFHNCIDAVRSYWQDGGGGVLGIHLEGPWINPARKGAHMESMIHSPTMEQVRALLEYGKGVITMITLAPEMCAPGVTDFIRSYGVLVSAGHSNATYRESKDAFAEGISTVTHLYNAMSPLQHRAPGLAGATMTDEGVMSSIIPDGHHVDYAAIRIAKAIMKERLFVITDAVTETDSGPYQHQFAGDKYESAGILSGSALNMAKAARNLIQYAGIEEGEAIRMCSLYPARLMGIDNELGLLKKGYRCALCVVDPQGEVITVVRD